MALEIGQLVVNARVVPDESHEALNAAALPADSEKIRREVIERCVDEVLRILQDRRER